MSTNRKSDNWSEYDFYPQLGNIENALENVLESEADLRASVDEARIAGVTWSAIADILGGSKQAAQQRFAPKH